MKKSLIRSIVETIPAAFFVLAGALSLYLWFDNVLPEPVLYVSGMDNSPVREVKQSGGGGIVTYAQRYTGTPSDLPGSWPRFRGEDFDNVYKEFVPLASSWGESGPDMVWSIRLGEGHGGAAVSGGRVYLLDYDEEKKSDALRVFSLADGQEIWRRWYPVALKRNHGFSRTVPAVTDKYVVTIGPACHVMAVESGSGEFLWGIDLELEFGTKVPFWYTGQCPMIDGEIAVIAPGGDALLMGVDLASGEILWETPNDKKWNMSHSSVVPMILDNKKMYVYSAIGGTVGVSAEGEDRGRILWETTAWSHSVIAPTPVVFDDGRIFFTAGYGGGSMMLKVSSGSTGFEVQTLYEYGPKDGLACEQQTPVLYDGKLFGILPKDAGALRNQFVCFDPVSREILWASGKTNQFGLGPFILADGKFYIVSDDGTLTVADASSDGFKEISKTKLLEGSDAWAPIAIAGGYMLVRNSLTLKCLDIRQK